LKGTLAVALIVVLCLSMFSTFTLKVNAQQSKGDWPMFRSNPSHNGAETGNAALTPTLLWNFTTGSAVYSSPAVVNGVVYIGSMDGNVYALNAENGNRIWNHPIGDDVKSSPAVVNGVVFVGSEVSAGSNGYVGNFYALNAADGSKIWNSTLGNYYSYIESSPSVVNGVVYVGSSVGLAPPPISPTFAVILGTVYALNATNGNKLWNYTTDSSVDSSPAVAEGIVYVGCEDGNLFALNATDGNKLWSYNTPGGVDSSPAVVGGVVYIGSFDRNVYALNAVSGAKLWNYTADDWIESSPAVDGGVVYIGADDGNVYALNATDGAKLWRYYISGYSFGSSPCVVSGVVYIGSYDHKFFALNATNGANLWNYTTGDIVLSSPAIVNGVVYFGSYDDNVYALGTLGTSPASPNTLPIIIGVAIAIVIVASVVFLMLKKRLKTKPTSPQTAP
jgi:eukaryotic-like serine/threonine-protein kinase